MSGLQILKLYLLTVPVFFVIDLLWLGVIAKGIYQKYLGEFLSDQVNWVAAIIFYLIFISGIIIFSVLPAVEKDSLLRAVFMGALFGFFTYATYDLTNLATLKGWPVPIVIIDIVWGMVLSGTVSAAAFLIAKRVTSL
jgi:uncharacterized membrane protein